LTEADLTTPVAGAAPAADSAGEAITRQIRGSNLLLAGRLLSLAVALATQVIIVRYLSKTTFGAFAYALAIVAVGETIATFGLDKAIARFVPIYHERGDRARVLGTIFMVAVTTATLGLAVVAVVIGLHHVLHSSAFGARDVAPLLVILVALAPLQALDATLVGLLAVFARPRAIFLRVYVLTPGLRLLAVVAVLAAHAGVLSLATGYVAAAAFGSTIYGFVLYRVLQSEGLLANFHPREIRVPVREILALTVPLLTTELLYVLIRASDTLVLGHFRSAATVASYAVVKPVAELNEIVLLSFGLLFVPLAARLFARRDLPAIDELYWQSAAWVATLSFPIFALTFLLAKPLLGALYGARYEGSGKFLMIVAAGSYAQAALGFNGSMLMVFGRIRYIVGVNALVVIVNLALNLTLIPKYGAIGAAIGTSVTYVLFNLLKQLALARGTSVHFFRGGYRRVYVTIGVAIAVLVAVHALDAPLALEIVSVVAASLFVVGANRGVLRIAHTFPEFRDVPLVRLLFRE
jgi:O-antigen/teichoic acid export membrane protein